jgi:nucleoid-associated protein YgaU
MIINGSRYYQTTATIDDSSIPVAYKKEPFVAKRTMTIITNAGDTFDKIAARILSDSTQYWKIAGLNPNIRFPDIIPTGTVVIVPIV